MSRFLPWISLVFNTLISAGIVIAIKVLTKTLTTGEIFLLRFLPISIIAFLILVIFYREALSVTFRHQWKGFLVRETIAILGFQLTWTYAASILPAGIVQLELATWPAMTMLLASVMLGEKLTSRKIVGAFLALAGVAAVFFGSENGTTAETGLTSWVWVKTCSILLIAPVSAAVVTVITRQYLINNNGHNTQDPLIFSLLCRMLDGFFVLAVFSIHDSPSHLIEILKHTNIWFWVIIGIVSIYGSLIGFWLWNWCILKLNATTVSSFSHLQTGVTLILALLILNESLTPLKIIAAVTILAGVFLTNIGAKTLQPIVEEGGEITQPVSSSA